MTILTKLGLITTLGAAAFFLGAPVDALAQSADRALESNCTQWQIDNGFCNESARGSIQTILNFFLGFLGLIAMGFLVYGGFLYVTAGASDENIDKAKKIITYAVVGIIVVFLAFALINTVISGLGNQGTPTA